mmetsp:Transcript_6581/g.19939  ORF Transcript_6581/g.19939 Transcript_6581/m.19939 type:complete len:190 (+) Transcript_6581:269-838(+)
MGCVPTKEKTSSNQKSLLMLGLDGSGSTTILYRLVLNKCIDTIPTLGFNQESLSYEGLEYDVWDIGGLDKVRPLWRQYSREADGFIFVVDAADKSRAPKAAEELRKFFGEGGKKSFVIPENPLLVFANKQDLPEAMPEEEIEQVLDLPNLPVHSYKVVACCGKTGENLREGLTWITDELKKLISTSDLR